VTLLEPIMLEIFAQNALRPPDLPKKVREAEQLQAALQRETQLQHRCDRHRQQLQSVDQELF